MQTKVGRASPEARGAALMIDGRPGSNLFGLVGELDLSTVELFEEAFDGIGGRGDVVFDLSSLAFIDVLGLHALTRVGRFLAKHRRRLILHDPCPELQTMLSVLGDRAADLHVRQPNTAAPRQHREFADRHLTSIG
jgi:anti-anti-sigma regulatory factor